MKKMFLKIVKASGVNHFQVFVLNNIYKILMKVKEK